jgi:hypothetical protein
VGANRPGRDVDHSPPSNADIKNEWSYVFMTSTRTFTFPLIFTSFNFYLAHLVVLFMYLSAIIYYINWLGFITETQCVYCAVRTVFMCFVWISEQTAIISLCSINWLVSITETQCVYCAVRTESVSIMQMNRVQKINLDLFFFLSHWR